MEDFRTIQKAYTEDFSSNWVISNANNKKKTSSNSSAKFKSGETVKFNLGGTETSKTSRAMNHQDEWKKALTHDKERAVIFTAYDKSPQSPEKDWYSIKFSNGDILFTSDEYLSK